MRCVKLLGQRLTARDFDRQVAELHVRVAGLRPFSAFGRAAGASDRFATSCESLNRFTTLGIPVTKAMGSVCQAKGNSD